MKFAATLGRPMDGAGMLWMAFLTSLWGLNSVSVKVVTNGISPIMGAALRSALALVLLTLYGLWRGEPLRYRGRVGLHGLVIGAMFSLEFSLMYGGARLSNAGHTALFINTSPLFVALGAHWLLPGERLTTARLLGLAAAFAGIVTLFADKPNMWDTGFWRGDLLLLASAIMWAASTLYIKRLLVGRMRPFGMLYHQILVSTPILGLLSLLFERERFFAVDGTVLLSLGYQGLVVVFFSYLMWMVLLHRYVASRLQSFTFMSPLWGVAFATILLGEPVSPYLAATLVLAGGGLYLINRRPARPGITVD
ncbi:MAG: DMT family transporter [SAR324 cluster bacterium]|nr:DMT family transporter [SAR324 cluster bacterium]